MYGAQLATPAEVTWVEWRHGVGTGLAFPDNVVASDESAALWFGGNLRFRP